MRSYDAPTQAALAASGIVRRGMILFQFPSGNYGFWDGGEPIVYNSITFKPGGQLIEVNAGEQTLGLDANAITLKLYANPDGGLTPNVLATIEAEDYAQRPVTIYKAIFNADTRALISVIPVWRGYVDTIIHHIGEPHYIEGRCQSRSIDYTKRGTALASNAQQQQISPGDLGLEYAGTIARLQVPFGRETGKDFAPEVAKRPVL